jgi:hypothetical protein
MFPGSASPIRHFFLPVALCLVFFLFPGLTGIPAQAKGAPVRPLHIHHVLPDDGEKDADFALLRRQLLAATKNHDCAFVEKILSENIATALGSGTGKENFKKEWQDLAPASPFWERLARVLEHGAQYDSESAEFHAPAVSFDDNHSPLPQAIVWNKNAPLSSSPGEPVPLRQLFDQQLTVLDPQNPEPIKSRWVKVATADRSKGFMKSEDIYSAYDEFVVFKKLHEKWTMTWFGFAGL